MLGPKGGPRMHREETDHPKLGVNIPSLSPPCDNLVLACRNTATPTGTARDLPVTGCCPWHIQMTPMTPRRQERESCFFIRIPLAMFIMSRCKYRKKDTTGEGERVNKLNEKTSKNANCNQKQDSITGKQIQLG